MIAIVDYGVGNLKAIQNIIRKVGGEATISSDPAVISGAQKLILPGVGAFPYGMQQLTARGLVPVLQQEVREKGKTILGLCLGAQLMLEFSEEGNVGGLGWLPGRVVKFREEITPAIPHMNWADVEVTQPNDLLRDIDDPRFYFAHSYHFSFPGESVVIGKSFYGHPFASAFRLDNILGVQFHPEKSHRFGMKLFENFLAI